MYLSFHLDGVGHKALYHLKDDNYKKAERAVILRKDREKQAIVKEKMQLQKELSATERKMLELEKVNITLYNRNQRLKSEMEKLGIVQKEKLELSAKEMQEWNDSINGHFASLRNIFNNGTTLEPIMQPIVISVERDRSGRNSFSLQPFLDKLYDENRDESIFRKQDFEICRKVLFGDISSPEEIEMLKEKKAQGKKPSKMEMFNISIALVSKWNVIFNKTQSYGRSNAAKGMHSHCFLVEILRHNNSQTMISSTQRKRTWTQLLMKEGHLGSFFLMYGSSFTPWQYQFWTRTCKFFFKIRQLERNMEIRWN